MRSRIAVAIVILVSLTVLLGAEGPEQQACTYTDALYGFTIQAPQFPEAPAGTGVIPVMMYAPAESGFATNVHVMVQRVAMTRQQYRETSLAEFKGMGLKVNSDTDTTVSGRDALIVDYEGKMAGRELRWLALAVVDKEQVLLVTCTAPKDSFEKYEKGFRACLDSFHLMN